MEFYAERIQPIQGPVSMLPQKGSTSGGTDRPLNSYAIRRDGFSILFDASFDWTFPGWEALADAGMPPRALVLSHRDTRPDAGTLDEIERRFDVPVLIHPADVGDLADRLGDPRGHTALVEAEVEVIEMPGHSPGSIMLYLQEKDGILLAGDSAVAPGPEQDAEPPRLERPKMKDEAAFCEAWRKLTEERSIGAVLPLHGRPYRRHHLGDRDFDAAVRNIWEGAPMDPSGG